MPCLLLNPPQPAPDTCLYRTHTHTPDIMSTVLYHSFTQLEWSLKGRLQLKWTFVQLKLTFTQLEWSLNVCLDS